MDSIILLAMMKVMSQIMATNKIDIKYTKTHTVFDRGQEIIYFFYPDGVWDENKLTFHEAKTKYPKTKYNWILMKDKD